MPEEKDIHPIIKSALSTGEIETAKQLGAETQVDPELTPEETDDQMRQMLKESKQVIRDTVEQTGVLEEKDQFPLTVRFINSSPENE